MKVVSKGLENYSIIYKWWQLRPSLVMMMRLELLSGDVRDTIYVDIEGVLQLKTTGGQGVYQIIVLCACTFALVDLDRVYQVNLTEREQLRAGEDPGGCVTGEWQSEQPQLQAMASSGFMLLLGSLLLTQSDTS